MSPRPRTVPDEVILEATARVIGRLGPSRFTLADVGAEAGLSAATLVQRFGTKRGLLLALAGSAADFVNDCFVAIRAKHASPLAALLVAATQMASSVDTPEELANSLAFLQLDLSDPEFHRLALESSRLVRAGYRALIDDAIAAGELEPCDSTRLASAVDATAGGSLIAWAIHREGDVTTFVRRDLEALLTPYRRSARRRTTRR
ncbi:MAG TPA: helix-turn-helix domain-containing protein [Gemmatimonadaceae bacterium]|nr:helix-turn-helix domain-containing protein [Gemmatimonadaceae bacterium]